MLNQVHFGDCRESLRTMAAAGVKAQMCVTSPPYFGLRDYGHERQIGLEQTPEQFIAELVEVFRSVRDVLADDGTLWVNIGDSYGTGTKAARQASKTSTKISAAAHEAQGARHGGFAKQLLGIPWRLALALQADGWVLRQDIIWHKPNPMPESVTDRCTKAHEYVFLLSKSPRYYYDAEAVKEKAVSTSPAGNKTHKYTDAYTAGNSEEHRTKAGLIALAGIEWETRNRRSVWTIATKPYKGAHFAVFPSALVEPCILAGSRPGDVVLDCFMGSGTTAAVAIEHGRQFIGCELNIDYKPLQDERITDAIAALVARQEEIDLAARQIDMFKEVDHA